MKRITLALGTALAFSLACSGGDVTDDPTDGTEEEEEEQEEEEDEEQEEAENPRRKLQGSWQLTPAKESIRKLRIMVAAASEDPGKIRELGDLTDEEMILYKDVQKAGAAEKKLILSLVEAMRDTRYIFQKGKVRIEVDGEKAGQPIPFEVHDATPKEMHVSFAQGGATKHWYVKWKGPKRADVDVQTEGSDIKFIHQLVRKE